jgi:glycosyltransferase involved in cell wall biosynthesis
MKTIKIFSLPTHCTAERTSGVDYARIISPMKNLNGYVSGDTKFETYIYDPVKDAKLDWLKVCSEYDVIYFNYTMNPWAFAAMGAIARMVGIPMIMDLDDNLWNVMKDNVAYEAFKPGSDGIKNLTAIINEVDMVTCTNQYLKNIINYNTRKDFQHIKVFDNCVDLDVYKYPQEFKDDGQITLTHFGSSTHYIDLQNQEFVEGINMVMRDYPNVNFMTVGAFIPEFKKKWGQRYIEEFGHQDVYKWISDRFPEVMKKTDICVVPLTDNRYTRCKSAIKYYEMSSAKKPGVWQDIRQYREAVCGTGYLVTTAKDWHRVITNLIENSKLRKDMGEKAYKDVVDNHQMKNNIEPYASMFIDILKK